MKQTTLGVIGGLGVGTSQRFCANVAKRVREATTIQPSILCHIVNLPATLENDLIYGRPSQEHLSVLFESVKTLDSAGVSSIAVPCNTVHVFIDQMRESASAPIFSIIEETSLKIAKMDLRKVGLLASSTTINAGLYQKELSKHGIEVLLPEGNGQKTISDLIFKILNGITTSCDEADALEVIRKMELAGADGMILGCTDLRMIELHSATPVIDSTTVLEDASCEYLIRDADKR